MSAALATQARDAYSFQVDTEVKLIEPVDLAPLKQLGWMLLDVRTDEEWALARIEGSTHIPVDQLSARLDEVADQVVCICAVGGRSQSAAQFLAANGREAANLEGGVQGFAAEGFPIQRG